MVRGPAASVEAGVAILPTTRLARSAKLGGLAVGQSARWMSTQTANRLRSDDRAASALDRRSLELADELVTQLGQMKGVAMKLGQVLSTVDFDLIPESEREAFKQRLATLRDSAPPVAFARIERLLADELGAPPDEAFARFERTPFAAASIGQVHRAVTRDGRDVAVKVQYPGVAEAVETDLRNLGVVLPLVKRLAPGLDARAILAELRGRIGDELDYEIEAQNQRAAARAFRGHPFIRVPDVDTRLSTRRVLVTELVDGLGFEAVKALGHAERDRYGEIVFRFCFGLLGRERLCMGDPHPGNFLLCPDGRVCFLDFGLMRHVDAAYLEDERALARAVSARDAGQTHRLMAALGYLPDPGSFAPERVLDQLATAGEWYFTAGERRLDPEYVRRLVEVGSSPRSPFFDQMRHQTLPPPALLMRRMEGLLLAVLGELRACADWGSLAREYFAGAEPSTSLGRLEAEHLMARAA
jgi:predicted unusual protein kinase regulating ubiquinone biosynthesis (AarF/ABC1/UbiB family)